MPGRPRDERARDTILRRAADIASQDGLEGLSIGRLATDLGMSKSGLFGYFGSKEELQLATIRTATGVYVNEVVQPALTVPPGLGRVRRLCENWLSYSQRRVFPGGCFFFAVTAEFDARPGRVRDAIAAAGLDWAAFVARAIDDARQLGELADDTDGDQLAFELIAFLEAANVTSLLHDDANAYERARTAIRKHLDTAVISP
ncbi:TetR/AcrR family transcriptional regulator [Nonomuraea glycinis]|uniref:TetR family transcriptional regulator n=1 Tax=Nonomuraea glycinis TaxID=2047744 RepID=A0A918E3S7_9ACTN|nr:TetR/AcrR family transcriptional regulator [Nonomuraea glycinis]MCA2174580.1 TetR/AcrR family transcriptional regulator [Nonomuraea glycinis]GGP02095.1 TetR family transcriptional regulator [Nonomuraea glycinis]